MVFCVCEHLYYCLSCFSNVILVLGVICYSKLPAYKISYKYMSLLDNTYLNFPTYFQIDEN